ncbi:MAG: amino acid--tRNA ligase-related protein [Planctomycetota bacterium]
MTAEGRPLRLVCHPQAVRVLEQRARLLAALRAVFDAQGFLEADVPALLPCAGQEAHLQPPEVRVAGLPGPLFLQTSPELSLKRLLCAGARRLYALGPAYRGGYEELSSRHQPQFTLLEWYRPGQELRLLIEDVRRLGQAAATALNLPVPEAGRVLSVQQACAEWAGVPLQPLLDGDVDGFVAAARQAGLSSLRAEQGAERCFERLLVERLEPALAADAARRTEASGALSWTFLTHWPAFAAALAQLDGSDPRLALRVEAYLGGLELGNGYVELADAGEHRRRWQREAMLREGPAPPVDEALLADLAERGLPPSVGMALGVDRLLMALTGAASLAEILPLALARD